MGTDLFGQYFNNPTKSYIYSNMLCNGSSADEISFDITDSDAVISDSANMLSKLDLSDVHVPLTQYSTDMKVIEPYGLIYIKGISQGSSYTTKAFGRLSDKVTSLEDWMYITTVIFHIKYVNATGSKVLKCIKASGSLSAELTFVESCQSILDEAKIPINVKFEDGFFYISSTVEGFDFWVIKVEMLHYLGEEGSTDDPALDNPVTEQVNEIGFGFDDAWSGGSMGNGEINYGDLNAYNTIISESQYQVIYSLVGKNEITDDIESYAEGDAVDVSTNDLFNSYLFEDLTKYVPAIKYKNGAMKGCVVVAKYPKYNASEITTPHHSLKIGHIKDRVEEYYTSKQNEYTGLPMYVRVIRDVVDSYFSQYEFDIYNKWNNPYSHINRCDDWIDPEEIPYPGDKRMEWSHSHVPNYYVLNSIYKDAQHYDAIGIYGYANYLSKHNGWINMGQLYAHTTVGDDASSDTKNLIPSFILYNPNSFPVVVNYMTFV